MDFEFKKSRNTIVTSEKDGKKTNLKTKANIYMVIAFMLICIAMLILIVNLARIQIIKADDYNYKGTLQNTRDITVTAKRGTIYDRNNKELATSVKCYTLYARTANIKSNYDETQVKELATKIASIVDGNATLILNGLVSEYSLNTVVRGISKEQMDEIKSLDMVKAHSPSGLEFGEAVKRSYPLNNFASQLLGSVTPDGVGRSGLELEYDQYLSGVDGRWVKLTDTNGNELVNGSSKYYPAQDGYSIVTTIDETIQYYAEKAVTNALEEYKADGALCIVMKPKTGEILASAATGGFNPNNPSIPDNEEEAEKFLKLSGTDQTKYLSKMWRNPIVSDTYEPGSTFKLLVAASSLEERTANLTEDIHCKGSYKLYDANIRCSGLAVHGTQTLKHAVANSCNIAFAQLAGRLGKTNFYKYLELFGISEKTNIDYPAESDSIIYSKSTSGPVELATMGYGQGISLTPIQLITAVSALGNDGVLMQPRYVSKIVDGEGNVVEEYEPKIVRRVVSSETAKEVLSMMEYTVTNGGGGKAKIAGYRIGGKTGTANKIEEGTGQYAKYYNASFVAMVPIDDPQLAILVVVDSPKNHKYGSTTAAPVAKEVLEGTLRYLGMQPSYTADELKKLQSGYTTVPKLTGELYSDAIGILSGKYLEVGAPSSLSEDDEWTVVAQYPEAGTKVKKNTTVYLYNK